MNNKENKKEKDILRKNWEKIGKIFDPFGGGSDSLVAEMLTLGLITYTSEQIPLQRPENLASIPKGSGNETNAHLILKYNAYLLLKKLGEKEPEVERDCYDVYSPKLKIRIECGHTDPDRLTWSFYGDKVTEFWVLQYPKEGDKSTFYKFKPSKECRNKLRAYLSEMSRRTMSLGDS